MKNKIIGIIFLIIIFGFMLASIIIKDEKGAIAKVATILAENNINIKNIGIVNNRESMQGVLNIVFENIKEKEKGYIILKNNNYEVKDVN